MGAQKSGTSSLYAYLTKHPQIQQAAVKEVHFFDGQYGQGIDWYRSFFRRSPLESPHVDAGNVRLITGEATPYYLFHPRVPGRVAKLLPNVKLLAILREPVARAYSHFQMERRRGIEDLSFEDAIEAEPARLVGTEERLLADDGYTSLSHRCFAYLARGVYVDQLLRWRSFFPAEQMLILRAEDLSTVPDLALKKALDFLGLPQCELKLAKPRNVGEYTPMHAKTLERLKEYFEPHNRRLYEMLNVDPLWA